MVVNPKLMVNEHGYYEARWRENGLPRQESFRTKDAAEAQALFGHFLLRTQPAPAYTVAQAWQLRQAEGMRNVVDKERIGYCWRVLLPFFGSKDIASLTQGDIDDYIDDRLDDDVSPATVRRELTELKATLGFMVRSRRLASTSISYFELPPDSEPRPHFLTKEQCELVLAEAARRRMREDEYTRLELFLLIGLHTGRRRRSIEMLEWSQVDFDDNWIHFDKPGEVRTRKRKGSILMRAALRAALLQEFEQKTNRWVLRMSGSVRTSFDTLMTALNLPNITPHTLRHTFVSHLLMQGRDIFTVSQLTALSIKQIEKTYGHLTKSHLAAALELSTA